MGWQDRDYARPGVRQGPGWHGRPPVMAWRRSIVTTLIVVNVGLYLLPQFFESLGVFIYEYGAMQAEAVLHGQVWRLFTAQYLHDPNGLGHIFMNMLVLHFLGRPLERMWSQRRFFTIYTLCGLAGNVFYTILGAQGIINPTTPAVGASGCIYGLLGIVAVMFPTATVYLYFLFPIKIRTAAVIFGGIALWTILQRGANYGGEACHLAGLVFGVWWAMKGDAWWSARRRSSGPGPVGPSPGSWRSALQSKFHRKPQGFQARVQERRDDANLVDAILKKVYDGGIHSLTEDEKRALQQATQRQQERDDRSGRTDRL